MLSENGNATCLIMLNGLPIALKISFIQNFYVQNWTRGEIAVDPQKYRLLLAGMLLLRLLPFPGGRVACFHGPPCRIGNSCGLEHVPKIKFTGETFSWLCFRFNTFSSCLLAVSVLLLMGRQESSCKQSALQLLLSGSGRHATAVVWCYVWWNTSLQHCHPSHSPASVLPPQQGCHKQQWAADAAAKPPGRNRHSGGCSAFGGNFICFICLS